jgi:hypothetical protein
MIDEKFYKIEGSKVTLTPEARELAQMSGLTDVEMARHLLQQDRLR